MSVYVARVRDTLEYGCQVYDCVLSEVQSIEIEAVQQSCLQIILSGNSRSYSHNLTVLGLMSLATRRKEL